VNDLEAISTPVPGPRSRELARTLRTYESHNVTYVDERFPIFWESGSGATITDVDGNRYLDLTSAFGVAAVGHANEAVAAAIAAQAGQLGHGMGDVHPAAIRARLLERLATIAPVDNAKVYLCSTGSEAIEYAMKTAMIAGGGDTDMLAFAGAYHGLSYGALEACGIPKFRKPFEKQLRGRVMFAEFPDMRERDALDNSLKSIRKTLKKERAVAAVLVEPIQGRAGYIAPPAGFLAGLREICTETATLLILDEIYTGFGRTGTMFACEQEGVRPDLLCVGKALGGGFPIGAVIGTGELLDSWPASAGEALHTSTFLGNPMACAAALAVLDEFERHSLVERAGRIGGRIGDKFNLFATQMPGVEARGRGAMWALQFRDGETASAVVARALQSGLIVLQAGLRGEVVTVSPPLTISDPQLERGLTLLGNAIRATVLA
jgi:4-aminobutyrate aminotransferase-like enzyme